MSTLAFAAHARREAEVGRAASVVSVEHDAAWLEKTRAMLDEFGLSGHVEFIHAPLAETTAYGRSLMAYASTHDFRSVMSGGPGVDLVLVDGPPGTIGRLGGLAIAEPYLSEGATILLDDAFRPGERSEWSTWRREASGRMLDSRVYLTSRGLASATWVRKGDGPAMKGEPDPRISVVIPCYNGGAYLREAIDSALAQSYPASEVIVVDDGSTDDSAAIAGLFGHPVRVIRQENRGESVARNRGVDEAGGDWIAFLDADDVWRPEKLLRQVEAIQQSGDRVQGVYTDYFAFTEGGEPRGVRVEELDRRPDYRIAMLIDWCILPSSSMVLASSARAVRFPEDIRHGEDRVFFWRLRHEGPFLHVPEALTGYRSSENQQTRSLDYRLKSSESYLSLLDKYEFSDQERAAIRGMVTSDLVLGHRRAYYSRDLGLARAYRARYAEVMGGVVDWPPDMAKPLYPRLAYRVKDWVDSWSDGGRRPEASGDRHPAPKG